LSKYGDIFIFLPKKVFRTIGSELFLNHHSTKLRQKKKKKKKQKKLFGRAPPFFSPISKWLNFAKLKITLRVEPRKNDGEEDEDEECGAFFVFW
jgi:hypothetical protein